MAAVSLSATWLPAVVISATSSSSSGSAISSGRRWQGESHARICTRPSVEAAFLKQTNQPTSRARDCRVGAYRRPTTMMPIGVPRMPYKTPGEPGMQWVDLWNIFYRERVVFIGQNIDEEFSNTIVATLLYLDSVSQKPLTFYINCGGGEVLATLALLDTMQHIKTQINTIAFGHAFSMGGLLLTAGTKGKRGAFPNTTIMLHAPSGTAQGQAADIINETRELLRLQEYLMNRMADYTNQPVDKLKRDLAEKGNMYLTPEQAVEYGAIDSIVRPRKDKGKVPI
eukprot:jgi/Chlat1/5199/Chrsp33S08973